MLTKILSSYIEKILEFMDKMEIIDNKLITVKQTYYSEIAVFDYNFVFLFHFK